ncbi:two-partner secretion domain-containing protein [Acaryochloris marina NIES-2412]|uniref:two-partner secretion domain-containing protein n=1 Tax=Acaryochloris marina TaxID=155978 RepID=UPI004058F36D
MQNLSIWITTIFAISLTLFDAKSTHSQVIPDETVDSRVTSQGNIFLIEAGSVRGRNLFHSFQGFSVPTGRTAYFNNVASIQNIFSRVTGNSISIINGTLQSNNTGYCSGLNYYVENRVTPLSRAMF